MNQEPRLDDRSARPIDRAAAAVRARSAVKPRIGLILGSGLGGLADTVDQAVALPIEIPAGRRQVEATQAGWSCRLEACR
jgi:purine nucleoside phosphorylase